jgi:hypothetical protein
MKTETSPRFGECDFDDCPYLKDDACTFHPKRCYIDEKKEES